MKTVDLLCAACNLCRPEYEFYKNARKKAMEELTLNGNEDGTFTVRSNKLGVEPIIFNSRRDVCVSCKQSVAMQWQCKRAICLTGGKFEKD